MVEIPRDIANELAPAEKVLWAGQPRQGVVLRAVDAFLIPFSLLWGGFAIFWEVSVATTRAPPFFLLFGAVFVVIGLYLIFGRFFFDARQRRRTFYAVTSERVVIVSGVLGRTVKSIDLRTLGEMSLAERGDGSGTIVFGSTSAFDWMQGGIAGWPGSNARQASRFELISDVRRVYETIRKAQRALSP
jgi:hypothetical protein